MEKPILRKTDFTPEFVSNLLSEFGTKFAAMIALRNSYTVLTSRGDAISDRQLREWLNAGQVPVAGREDESRTARIEKLLDRANVPLDQLGAVSSIKFGQWGTHMKGPDGKPVTGVLDKTEVTFLPTAPAFPVLDRAAAGPVFPSEVPRLLRKTRTAFIYSDAQMGFLQNPETKETSPIHDPVAMTIARRIMAAVQPEEVAIIGDWMDLPFLSRWQQHDEFDAVNESIQAAYDELRQIKADAGTSLKRFTFVEGNHDQRFEKVLLEHNRKALRIRRAADTTGWPVFSMPYLLRFDELGITTTGRYPGGDYYILPDLALMHAPPRVAEFNASVIHGHTHKLAVNPRVAHSYEGRKSYYMYDIGCLCMLGITSDVQRLMVTAVPSDRGRTNWHQGVAVVNIVDGEVPWHSVDLIRIQDGKALYGGEIFDAGA